MNQPLGGGSLIRPAVALAAGDIFGGGVVKKTCRPPSPQPGSNRLPESPLRPYWSWWPGPPGFSIGHATANPLTLLTNSSCCYCPLVFSLASLLPPPSAECLSQPAHSHRNASFPPSFSLLLFLLPEPVCEKSSERFFPVDF